jgi:GR25 family glycosyltransferase involved in LPS biosynthesis
MLILYYRAGFSVVYKMLNLLDIAVINLDRRPDRMACVYKNIPFLFKPFTPNILTRNIITGGDDHDDRGHYRRFPAIDGNNLSQHYSEFADLLDTIRDTPRVLGEVGCSLSHYSLWQSHAQHPNAEFLLVLEDDVLFTEKSHERIRDAVAALTRSDDASSSPDVVYVGGQWTPDYDIDCSASPPYFSFQKTTSESLARYYKPPGPGSGSGSGAGLYPRRNLTPAVIQGNRNVWFTPLFRTAGAYLVSQCGAKRLLEAVETDTALFMKTPLDMWLLEMDFRGYIHASDRFPHPFYQAGFEMVREPSHAQNDIHRTDFRMVKLPEPVPRG